MTFSDPQTAQIRMYLGYPDGFRNENSRLENAMIVVGDRPEVQAIVEGILAQLVTIESSLTASIATAGMKKAEDIEWYDHQSIMTGIRKEGKRLTNRLSVLFGVPKNNDAFGEAGYPGDTWFQTNNWGIGQLY